MAATPQMSDKLKVQQEEESTDGEWQVMAVPPEDATSVGCCSPDATPGRAGESAPPAGLLLEASRREEGEWTRGS